MAQTDAAEGEPTPFDLVTRTERARPTTKALLLALCRGLEREALAAPPGVARVCLQDARHLTPGTLRVYEALARAGTDVAMFGRGLRAWLAPRVRGVALGDDDPLGDVWSVVFDGCRRPVAMAALDLFTDGTTDAERPFRVAVSRDPDVAAACERVLRAERGAVSGEASRGTTRA